MLTFCCSVFGYVCFQFPNFDIWPFRVLVLLVAFIFSELNKKCILETWAWGEDNWWPIPDEEEGFSAVWIWGLGYIFLCPIVVEPMASLSLWWLFIIFVVEWPKKYLQWSTKLLDPLLEGQRMKYTIDSILVLSKSWIKHDYMSILEPIVLDSSLKLSIKWWQVWLFLCTCVQVSSPPLRVC